MTGHVASLAMYDAPGLQSANDALWSAIAHHLRAAGLDDVPAGLDRTRSLEEIWDDPNLLLAQACGYPLATQWRGRLRYVATPHYKAAGCEGASHRSRIVVRRDEAAVALPELRGRRAAVNAENSNTGMNLFRTMAAPLATDGRFFGSVLITGSHHASIRAVAAGEADIAAIDCVTFAHLEREDPLSTRRLRTLAWSPPSPGLPLVTSAATSDAGLRILRRAVRQAIRDDANGASVDALLIAGVDVLRQSRYDALEKLAAHSTRRGYPELK
ncbi:phosphate/phosphite/phosphonate ABC transporter substrate-binding protein [Sphingomonas abietis]|uniref:PhnD/SsuA/transferrin family substrate-binding protein n=1 Tax=Sphingomonas abietis TaxID=3012344 RepID=A0ABY7NQD0_9SPHN|nr:PhnD/SsuA/transferrin family substrate-binding protein [Sphingomonas abietis]WBO23749.1 PhnD/SsuA/transferrin family substrate-binding protein [Sphingomonas abietis]